MTAQSHSGQSYISHVAWDSGAMFLVHLYWGSMLTLEKLPKRCVSKDNLPQVWSSGGVLHCMWPHVEDTDFHKSVKHLPHEAPNAKEPKSLELFLILPSWQIFLIWSIKKLGFMYMKYSWNLLFPFYSHATPNLGLSHVLLEGASPLIILCPTLRFHYAPFSGSHSRYFSPI